MKYIDLHIHTTASDGMFAPREVVKWAYRKNLKAIAITDHDNTDGIQEAMIEGNKYNVEVIPGIEINTEYKELEIHILAYYINYKEGKFQELLKKIRLARYERAEKMIKKLNTLGFSITMEQVIEISDSASIGRPHVARVLYNHGYVKSIKEAFDLYLGRNKPAYVERYKITPIDAIKHISECDGIPIVAHPGLIGDNSVFKELVDGGIQGIEVFHPKHNQEMTNLYYHVAKQYNLLITGGTDCHGMMFNGEPLLGSLKIDEKYLDMLKHKKMANMEMK